MSLMLRNSFVSDFFSPVFSIYRFFPPETGPLLLFFDLCFPFCFLLVVLSGIFPQPLMLLCLFFSLFVCFK